LLHYIKTWPNARKHDGARHSRIYFSDIVIDNGPQ
jgi:hypothetical protein